METLFAKEPIVVVDVEAALAEPVIALETGWFDK